jgi:hypothetical protein
MDAIVFMVTSLLLLLFAASTVGRFYYWHSRSHGGKTRIDPDQKAQLFFSANAIMQCSIASERQ